MSCSNIQICILEVYDRRIAARPLCVICTARVLLSHKTGIFARSKTQEKSNLVTDYFFGRRDCASHDQSIPLRYSLACVKHWIVSESTD